MKALRLSPSFDASVSPLTAHRWRPVLRVRAHKASNDLLSVLATPGQTPHPLFALRRIEQALGKALLLVDGHCEKWPGTDYERLPPALHSALRCLLRRNHYGAYAFSTAPAGITP